MVEDQRLAPKKRIVFLTGTRAEYGKLKPLIEAVNEDSRYDAHIFVTGMHMLEKYGGTAREILKEFSNVYMYNNQPFASHMDIVLSNTVYGFSHYIGEINPDLIIIHGDRVEALAGAIVGTFNNILVAHIEGGEISGTIDELIRHSITKLAHIHFVANEQAQKRLIQMGEKEDSIYIIGSPDIDSMFSENLPDKEEVFRRYELRFDEYGIMIYHPVTTEISNLPRNVKELVDAVIESNFKYIVIYPNNDIGSKIILEEYKRIEDHPNFRLFPSIRFENFLVLLKNSKFIIGNSSAGIREAPVYSIPTINLGTRQQNRFHHDSILHIGEKKELILATIRNILSNNPKFPPSYFFGDGRSVSKFMGALEKDIFWKTPTQKQFVDIYPL